MDGVAFAISSTAIKEGRHPDTLVHRAVRRNFHPRRSGEVYVVFDQQRFENVFDGVTVTSNHGSLWRYDTWVPVVFAGGAIKGQRVARRIETVEVAPTLSVAVGAGRPSGSQSGPLDEVVRALARRSK